MLAWFTTCRLIYQVVEKIVIPITGIGGDEFGVITGA